MSDYSSDFLAKIPSVNFCLADATKDDVLCYLFKSSSQTIAITLNNEYILPEDDKKVPMKILFHGYTSNVTTPWYQATKRAYFQKGHHNIVYVDWSIASNKSFAVSAANIKPVGELVADLIVNLQIPLENVHLIGHSLGAHLAGFVGKYVIVKTGKKVGRITATDPAGPGFENVGRESRLCKYDASFVDVIHTDAGYFGITKPIGDVDFYINGGGLQPGCPSRQVDDNCSHGRSNIYFIESILTNGVIAKSAKLIEGHAIVAPKFEEIEFGDLTPKTARGLYYVKTKAESPYLTCRKKIKKS